MSLKQQSQVPAAFEIRFSQTDSQGVEVFEIQPDPNQERIPDPFKKRDKIPRSSTNLEQYSNIINSSINNITAPVRHSTTDSQGFKPKSRHSLNDEKGMSTNSNGIDQVSSIKVKSSNAVRPDVLYKNSNVERVNSDCSIKNALDDEPIIRSVQPSNKKQRVEESVSEKEKGNLGKAIIPNHQIMDLNGKTEMVVSINKKIKQKSIRKNKKTTNYNNIINKDEENKSLPKDGIATPPATPPRSPQMTPSTSQPHSDDGISAKLEESQLVTPPPSSNSSNFDDVSTPSTSMFTQSSRKRRESQSSQKSQITLATKRSNVSQASQASPRGRRLSSTSTSQQSQPPMIRSRIPRLSISSRERPIIAKKPSQESLSSMGSNKSNGFNESSPSDLPATSKLQPPRVLRLSTSRPIINTFMSDMEVESESPTSYSLPSYSPPSLSPPSHSPTSHSPPSSSFLQKKPIIPHDEVIVPTVAKKLKMNGQLHFANHDALLGYSEEPENISPTTENGYVDITDQVVDLFDASNASQNKSHKKQPSIPDSRLRRQQSSRKNSSSGHSRNSSKTHYIVPRKQNHNQPAQQTFEEPPSPMSSQFENSSNPSTFIDDDFNKRRKSRREEYIMVVRDDDDDDDDLEFTEPLPPMPYVPPEPFTAPIVQPVQVETNDQIYYNKIEEPIPEVQMPMPVMQAIGYNPNPAEAAYDTVVTNDKKKKNKKKQKKNTGDLEEEDYVRKSKCRCAIQ